MLLAMHPKLRDSVPIVHQTGGLLSPSMAACLHYLFSRKSREQADEFFKLLFTGENISRSSPTTSGIYLLCSRLLDNRANKEKLPADEIPPLVVKAWNGFRKHEVIKTLRWNASEDFPQIA